MDSYGVGGEPTVEWDVVDSGIGPLLLAATATGLVNVAFHARPAVRDAVLDRLRTRFGTEPVAAPGSARLAEPIRRLAAYFAGEPRDFDLALDWSLTSGFHREVLRELASGVPYGTVVGYPHSRRTATELELVFTLLLDKQKKKKKTTIDYK
ncbi:hypothetical protein PV702_30510, partial [Streptomyces sp. FL06-04B]|uniref:methylated-DNA--[protein]-cysteine S-methyltransferase n=1 Tax=Streptomyces sp. FL06-04B TaxID=3028657 RepID=UPI0029ADF1C1|nr:hypothetical protein [Streptomyces sp. FL06-04B]